MEPPRMVSCFSSRRREHLLQNRSREEVGKRSRDRKKPQGSRELRERAARGGRATTPTVAAPVADGDDATFRVALLPPCGFLRRFPAAHRAEEPNSPPQLHAVTQGEINQAAHALLLSLPLTFFTSRGNAEKSRSYCWLYDCASLLMTCSSHELAEEVAFPMSTARALDEWCVCRESERGGGGEFLIPPVSVVGRSSSCRKKVLLPALVRTRPPRALPAPSNRARSLCRRVARRASGCHARRRGRRRRAAAVARRGRGRGDGLNSACSRDPPALALRRWSPAARRRRSPGGQRGSRRGRRPRKGATTESVHVEGNTEGARGLAELRNGSARGEQEEEIRGKVKPAAVSPTKKGEEKKSTSIFFLDSLLLRLAPFPFFPSGKGTPRARQRGERLAPLCLSKFVVFF